MLAPGWAEGCPGCSFLADHFGGAIPHLAARDVTFVAVSRAPLAEIVAFKRRMEWQFPWVSSHGTSFNRDYGVTFTPEEIASGTVFHTYSTYARGLDVLLGTYLPAPPRPSDDLQRGAHCTRPRHIPAGRPAFRVKAARHHVEMDLVRRARVAERVRRRPGHAAG